MPPLPADSIHARACKLKCEKILTRPIKGLAGSVFRIFPKYYSHSIVAGGLDVMS